MIQPYQDKGYNLNKLASGGITLDTLEKFQRRYTYISYEDFVKIVNLLVDTKYTLSYISKETEIPIGVVKNIYERKSYAELTQDLVFTSRERNGWHEEFQKLLPQISCLNEEGFSTRQIKQQLNLQCPDNMIGYYMKYYNIKPNNGAHKVYQFDLHGEYINTFRTAQEAAKTIGTAVTSITDCCKNKRKHAANYIWSFTPELRPMTIIEQILGYYIIKSKVKPVIRYNKITNLPEKLYVSAADTQEDGYCSLYVGKVANGKMLTHKNKKWKYVTEESIEDLNFLYNKKG